MARGGSEILLCDVTRTCIETRERTFFRSGIWDNTQEHIILFHADRALLPLRVLKRRDSLIIVIVIHFIVPSHWRDFDLNAIHVACSKVVVNATYCFVVSGGVC